MKLDKDILHEKGGTLEVAARHVDGLPPYPRPM